MHPGRKGHKGLRILIDRPSNHQLADRAGPQSNSKRTIARNCTASATGATASNACSTGSPASSFSTVTAHFRRRLSFPTADGNNSRIYHRNQKEQGRGTKARQPPLSATAAATTALAKSILSTATASIFRASSPISKGHSAATS